MSPTASTLQTPSKPVEKGDEVVVGTVSVMLPSGYAFDSDQDGFTQFTGPDAGIRHNPAILRLSSDGFTTNPAADMGLLEGACPMKHFESDIMLVSGRSGYVTRDVYACGAESGIPGVWTYVFWKVEDPKGPTFSADYFGSFDRRPGELTEAFQKAVWME